MTTLICPKRLTLEYPDALIGLCGQALEADDNVTLDARALRLADPFGLAMLGATFYMLQQRGQPVRVSGLTDAVSGYLQRMDVFHGVELVNCATPRGQRRDRRDALVELKRLDQRGDIDRAANQLAEALVGRMPDIDTNEPPDEMTCKNTADRIAIPISYALSELLNNAMSHARRKGHTDASVWVASQYYRGNGRLQLAVVDNGCGMLETLREHAALRDFSRKTDLEAILAALRPRVSCNRDLGVFNDSVNQGVGLTTTSRIAEHAGGRLVVVSGAGYHDPLGQSRRLAGGVRWGGVAIGLECQRDTLMNVRYQDLLPPVEDVPSLHLRFEE
jgi:signal transduction histidine kinase